MSDSLLLNLFRKKGLIKKAIYTKKPRRAREKRVGAMWKAKVEVTTRDGKKYYFDLWYHIFEDNGPEEWKPSFARIRDHMVCETVEIGGKKYYEPNKHIICVDNTYYFSKPGFSICSDEEKDVIEQVENGTWTENPDIVLLV